MVDLQALDARLYALIDAHAQGRNSIEQRVLAALTRIWTSFDGWYTPPLVDEAAEMAWTAVGAGQYATAALTDAYLSESTAILAALPVDPVGVDDAWLTETLRGSGVTGQQVQARVPETFRFQITLNKDVNEAMAVALSRAEESVSQDLNLASRAQTHKFMRRRGITTYRRVTRGEGTCGMCMAASNRVYRTSELMPLHARCRCSVIAVGEAFPGSPTSDADYAMLAGVSRSLHARDLKDVRYVIDEHGELGPVLRNREQKVSTAQWRRGKTGDIRRHVVRGTRGKPHTIQQPKRVDAGLRSFWDQTDLYSSIQGHKQMREWSRRHGQMEQVAWQDERIRLMEARLEDLKSGRLKKPGTPVRERTA